MMKKSDNENHIIHIKVYKNLYHYNKKTEEDYSYEQKSCLKNIVKKTKNL